MKLIVSLVFMFLNVFLIFVSFFMRSVFMLCNLVLVLLMLFCSFGNLILVWLMRVCSFCSLFLVLSMRRLIVCSSEISGFENRRCFM